MKIIDAFPLLLVALFTTSLSQAFACGLVPCANGLLPDTVGGRKWDIQYVIIVDRLRLLRQDQKVIQAAVMADKHHHVVRSIRPIEQLFTPTLTVRLPQVKQVGDDIGAVFIAFANNGDVTTPNTEGQALRGEITDRNNFVLIPKESADGLPYFLADWFQGWSDPMRAFTPAVCKGFDDYRYKKKYTAGPLAGGGNFGCREWSYQLLNPERPYIDVTSYEKSGTFIKAFVGWAPFDGNRKPVIGKHNKLWICLLDCPNGEPAGVIQDIQKWCKANRFPLPQRPKKTPMFPDRDFPFDADE